MTDSWCMVPFAFISDIFMLRLTQYKIWLRLDAEVIDLNSGEKK